MPVKTKVVNPKIGIPSLPKDTAKKIAIFPEFKFLIQQAWAIYQQYRLKFIGMYLLMLVPALVAGSLIAMFGEASTFINQILVWLIFSLLLVLFVLVIVVGAYSMIFLIKGLDNNISVWQAYLQAWKYFWRYAWLFILLFILVGLGFVALVIPGLVLLIWFSQVFYVAAFEGLGGKAALQRSKSLVHGYWWTILERYVYWLSAILLLDVFLLLPLIILIAAGVPSGAVAVIQGLISLLSLLINFVIVPLGVVYTYLVYKNLKSIKAKNVLGTDGMNLGRKLGIVAIILVYLLINTALDYSGGTYDLSAETNFNYQFDY